MKSKTRNRFILIAAVLLLAAYFLYPTIKFSMMSEAEKEKLKIENQKKYFELKSKTINLGLDLQGGMHVVLEVDVKELLKRLAKNVDETFTTTLVETEKRVEKSDEDFLAVFDELLQQKGSNITRYYYSPDHRTRDEVLKFLRKQINESVDRALEILRNRVDEFGVSEPTIQKVGDRRIIVELAGVTDPTRVRKLIGRTAQLEFKLLEDAVVSSKVAEKINNFIQSKINPYDSTQVETEDTTKSEDEAISLDKMFSSDSGKSEQVAAKQDSNAYLFEEGLFFLNPRDKQTFLVPVEKQNKFQKILELPEVQRIIAEEATGAEFLWGSKPVYNGQYMPLYLVRKNVELTGETITDANPQRSHDPSAFGQYEVSLTLNDAGARTFARVTGANVGKRLAIVLDHKVYLAPEIRVKITNGRAVITGLDRIEEAQDLSIVLKAGALPAPVKFMEERTVGPSLGQDSINAGTFSAIMGLILVMIFMVIYYKLSGLIADLALVLNIVFIMAVMAYFHATLTLPGIAGIILTIGMAVDANVLIFERVREELGKGKTVRASIDVGYGKAFITILDANVTTFIAGLVLYTYGSGPIQGFALTLMIGIVSSLFTAIVVTRVIFDYVLETRTVKRLSI
ncbi:MAG TPA: protein translocase subunit SecD [Caldithrix abyssi]|uniref:Protein translocase subunit SecD n=1 Tax=Caldithrix abyssi TaxID=187145 RepID=A0A7V5H526_CALAY|nr:protein translocase subunit SecD [Caldithrix abyssi]